MKALKSIFDAVWRWVSCLFCNPLLLVHFDPVRRSSATLPAGVLCQWTTHSPEGGVFIGVGRSEHCRRCPRIEAMRKGLAAQGIGTEMESPARLEVKP